jgi:CRISPR-associated endonuclease/helicase Cas3
MSETDFDAAFETLTGNPPFPWQRALYRRFVSNREDNIPATAALPTGLGKTNVIAIWLLALAAVKEKIPRRLVYVVNRRTVVDQTTAEVEKLRNNLRKAGHLPEHVRTLAISTLRGQHADNQEWTADPTRPAVIAGTVDMIGSRLLFSGYGRGYKSRPLHAGFLGQDVLLVHDEAHLEPAFQCLIESIRQEQERCQEFRRFRVLALTATLRGGEHPFELTPEEREPPDVLPAEPTEPIHVVWRRLKANKTLALIPVPDEEQVVPKIVELAWQRGQNHSGSAIIVFVRTVEAVDKVRKGLRAKKVPDDSVSTLTGTMRGFERSRQADPRQEGADPVFARFLPLPKDPADWKTQPRDGTVYLICTAAGEVGVDISSDHLVCDLTPFDSMVQRFGRVNRYGLRSDTCIDVVHEEKPSEKKKADPFDQRRWPTLLLLRELNGGASPAALGRLPLPARIAAFTPTPTILPTSDILFDAWALTTASDRLPGRPPVADYLHGVAAWQPPETHVAWREEVQSLTERFTPKQLADLLEDYPLKPHELLRNLTKRVLNHLNELAEAHPDSHAWVIDDGTVRPTTLKELAQEDPAELRDCTILLPPEVGGLTAGGTLGTGNPPPRLDVADEWRGEDDQPRRRRVWDEEAPPEGMRLVREVDTNPNADKEGDEEESPARRFWRWYVRPRTADDDASKTAREPIRWDHHTSDVFRNAARIADALLKDHPDLHTALVTAAKFHDLGKKRVVWQKSIGNPNPTDWHAKSGRGWKTWEITDYRHEFGSLLDILDQRGECWKEFERLLPEQQDLVLHLICAHHGRGRPHFPAPEAFDPTHPEEAARRVAAEVPRRFAHLQRRYGRWGLAYLESLLRAADAEASANPSPLPEEVPGA